MANPGFPKPDKVKMKLGRKRRAAGWTLLVLGMLVAGVWTASGWWQYYWIDSSGEIHISIRFGQLFFENDSRASRHSEGLTWTRFAGWSWWHNWQTNDTNTPGFSSTWRLRGFLAWQSISGTFRATVVVLVLWPIPLLLWTSAALLLRSGILARRRASTNACSKCGYSLAGLASHTPCPECGKAGATPA